MYTFDPRNHNYEKAFHLAWSTLCEERNRNTLGNILESLLGVRNAIVKYYGKEHDPVIESVCERVSNFVNAVYQFTQWTNRASKTTISSLGKFASAALHCWLSDRSDAGLPHAKPECEASAPSSSNLNPGISSEHFGVTSVRLGMHSASWPRPECLRIRRIQECYSVSVSK